jgi:bifunctional UDP-N-acetylglucosamine pyrophosphorylase/glucosamine-1-phosphate N-acetyltransferase
MAMSVILAAGKGTRMRSELPKVLHRLLGAPLLEHAIEKVEAIGCDPKVVVVGYGREQVEAEFAGRGILWAFQADQRGTGHAACTGIDAVPDYQGEILVLNGDLPLLDVETLRGILEHHRASRADVTALTCKMADPTGYGRIIRDSVEGLLRDIREEKDCDDATRAIPEGNVGTYVFNGPAFRNAYAQIRPDNRQGEYYLTDVVVEAARLGLSVETYTIPDGPQIAQVNSRREMAAVGALLRRKILEDLMDSGVTIDDPLTTYIEKGVKVGIDAHIFPFVHIERGVEIGPGCEVGPFVHLRPGTVLEAGASIGNYVEIKASRIGPGVKARHLSYIGDAQIGKDVNIGAGTIFANFDGKKKNRTVVKARAFIGSGTVLVAPVTIGEGAMTGAGAVVTRNRDVPDGDIVVGIPARSLNKKKDEKPAGGTGT